MLLGQQMAGLHYCLSPTRGTGMFSDHWPVWGPELALAVLAIGSPSSAPDPGFLHSQKLLVNRDSFGLTLTGISSAVGSPQSTGGLKSLGVA